MVLDASDFSRERMSRLTHIVETVDKPRSKDHNAREENSALRSVKITVHRFTAVKKGQQQARDLSGSGTESERTNFDPGNPIGARSAK